MLLTGAARREAGELRPGGVEQLSPVPAPPAAVGPATPRTGLECRGPLAGRACPQGPRQASFLSPLSRGAEHLTFSPILLSRRAHWSWISRLKSEADPSGCRSGPARWVCACQPSPHELCDLGHIRFPGTQAPTAMLCNWGGKLVQSVCPAHQDHVPKDPVLRAALCRDPGEDAVCEAFKFRSVQTLNPKSHSKPHPQGLLKERRQPSYQHRALVWVGSSASRTGLPGTAHSTPCHAAGVCQALA